MGHSSAVRLRSVTFHSLREMMPDRNNGPLKRRSAKCYLSLSTRDDTGINKWDTQTAFALAVRLVNDLPRINMLKE